MTSDFPKDAMSAILFGGSGAVGSGIIEALSASPAFSKVTLVLRQPIRLENYIVSTRKFEQVLINFEHMEDECHPVLKQRYDVAFYAIGLNLATPEQFQTVEVGYATKIMKLLHSARVPQFHYVSSMHASPTSYWQIFQAKGQVEEIAKSIGFPRLAFYRTGGVLTKDGKGMKPFLQFIGRYFDPFRIVHIEAERLGRAMVNNSMRTGWKHGAVEIYEHSGIKGLAI